MTRGLEQPEGLLLFIVCAEFGDVTGRIPIRALRAELTLRFIVFQTNFPSPL